MFEIVIVVLEELGVFVSVFVRRLYFLVYGCCFLSLIVSLGIFVSYFLGRSRIILYVSVLVVKDVGKCSLVF